MKILFLISMLSLAINSAFAEGTVTGYDFNGLQVRAELPSDFACTAIATLESDACYANNGESLFDKDCNVLCTLPIAPKGMVSGFDFNGLQIRPELSIGFACASIATLESDACYKIGGSTVYDKNCNNLCSFPIAPQGKVAGYNFNGLQVREELPSNFACPLIATLESDACYKIKGSTLFDKDCNALCTSPISKN